MLGTPGMRSFLSRNLTFQLIPYHIPIGCSREDLRIPKMKSFPANQCCRTQHITLIMKFLIDIKFSLKCQWHCWRCTSKLKKKNIRAVSENLYRKFKFALLKICDEFYGILLKLIHWLGSRVRASLLIIGEPAVWFADRRFDGCYFGHKCINWCVTFSGFSHNDSESRMSCNGAAANICICY